ncbi:MAG TPA: proline dehydrogenase family protein [Chitinophagaceae bacterium]|nr:proline dehydrogenase family protein [Chitinophagaceae bacterium]
MNISFENTETAFEYKSDSELKKAKFLFASMAIDWLVKLGTKLTPWIIKSGLPVKGMIRKTIFSQFVGGETLSETSKVVDKLSQFNVKVILDYGVEGKEGEENFDQASDNFIKVIEYASSQPNIPFISVKLTGFARFELLQKLDAAAKYNDTINGTIATDILSEDENREWQKVESRLDRICEAARISNTGVLIDAEESWIQNPVDALTAKMMNKFNVQKAIVYNTIQLYRHDRLQFLKDSFKFSINNNFIAGFKLVRGAYMEKEYRRASELYYISPIQPDKQKTDDDYNAALTFCIERLNELYAIVATHNEFSNLYAVEIMEKLHLSINHPHIHFSQLYGMSDNITFNLAKAGCPVSKYLPFGPIKDVIPYLMRRAQENSSVSDQTGRELALIKKEIERRATQQ